jgi:hypothetical protein
VRRQAAQDVSEVVERADVDEAAALDERGEDRGPVSD